jgi:ABC-type transport system involved in multi-copper enzyme maturation permease subunit
MNPVLARELRIRLRSRRAWILLTVYLLVLAGILYLVYTAATNLGSNDPFDVPSPIELTTIGRSIFEWMLLFMLLLVLFLVPGFTSGAIAGERERQTLVPMQVTLLRPWQIVVGKLTASFAFLALLVVATAPFLGVAYLVGGVTFATVLKGVAVVLFTGLVVGAITVCCSTVFRRVQVATVVSYVAVLALVVGSFLAWGTAGIIDRSRGTDEADPPARLLVLNPLFLAADVVADLDATSLVGSSPFKPMAELLQRDALGFDVIDPGFGRFEGDVVFPGGFAQGEDIIGFDQFGNPVLASQVEESFPFWAASLIALYLVGVGAAVIAVRRLRTPTSIER